MPGEGIEECARRELAEETGLRLDISPTIHGTEQWSIFIAEAREGDNVVLDDEHDRFVWTSPEEAVSKCLPTHVGESFRLAMQELDQGA